MSDGTKRALVTGGTVGLGRAMCDQLGQMGFAVTSLDKASPERTCGFTHIACDLSDTRSVDAALVQAIKGGPYEVVVFNAGISATGQFEAIEPSAHMRLLAVNAEAPMVLCAALVAAQAIKRDGHIAFISSLSHFTGYPGAASYGASKDAVAIYARSIRKPFAKAFGLSVTCVFPGPLRTDHAARHAPEGAKAEKRMTTQVAAELILKDVMGGKAQSLPGFSTKVFAVVGRLAPKSITKLMRQIIYQKLEKTVAD